MGNAQNPSRNPTGAGQLDQSLDYLPDCVAGTPPAAGQSASSADPIDEISAFFRGQLFDARRVAALSWDDFLDYLRTLNKLCAKHVDAKGRYVMFALKKGTVNSVFWKAMIKICALKMNSITGKVESRRFLSLVQFLRLHKCLQEMVLGADGASSPHSPSVESRGEDESTSSQAAGSAVKMPVSLLLERMETLSVETEQDTDLERDCTICMERRPELILPCTHCYCAPCFEQWSEYGKRWCPLCKAELQSCDEPWFVPPAGDGEGRGEQISNYLVSLANEPAEHQ